MMMILSYFWKTTLSSHTIYGRNPAQCEPVSCAELRGDLMGSGPVPASSPTDWSISLTTALSRWGHRQA